MKELPTRARVFLWGVYLTSAVALWLTYAYLPPVPFTGAIWEIVAFVGLAAIAGHKKT